MSSALSIHFTACAVLVLISIPLILKRIPPNRLYGVRTVRTLSNPTIWYKVNWFGGWTILLASVVGAANLMLAALFLPALLGHAGLLVLVPLLVAVVGIWVYSMRIGDRH